MRGLIARLLANKGESEYERRQIGTVNCIPGAPDAKEKVIKQTTEREAKT